MTLGSKFERNEFTGFEVQPTIRARWSAPRRSVWGAVSRAVRVPTRFDTDLRIRFPNSPALLLTGSEAFKSETLIAYEAGYRKLYSDRLSVDVAVYVNRYDDLRSQELPTGPGQPIVLANMLNALSRGVEVSTAAQRRPGGRRTPRTRITGRSSRSMPGAAMRRAVPRKPTTRSTSSSCARI